MLKLKRLRDVLLFLVIFAWFFGIGSWSDFFGFMTYGLLPDNRPPISSHITSEQSFDNPKGKAEKNQFKQKQTFTNSVNPKNERNVDPIEGYQPN